MIRIREAVAIELNLRRAESKHPTFPEIACQKHTTYRALAQSRDYWRKINDGGRETVSSVLNEEIAELLCELFKKRWGRAERELLDVIAVCFRLWRIIRSKRKERYNRVVSYLKYKRMLRFNQIQHLQFPYEGSDVDPITYLPISPVKFA